MTDLTVTVKLTQSNIDCGFPKDCKYCPVALAVVDALNLTVEQTVYASQSKIEVAFNNSQYPHWEANTPEEFCTFMRAFDNDQLHDGPTEAVVVFRPNVHARFQLEAK